MEVRRISCPFFSIRKEWNSFSMISARVATVPRPPVSVRALRSLESLDSIYCSGFSMALNRVASVNLGGGVVLPEINVI